MRAVGSSLLVFSALWWATSACAQEESFGSPAMLPLPTSTAPPVSGGYYFQQPIYPPGLMPAAQPVYQPIYVQPQPVYTPVYAPPQTAYMPMYVQPQPSFMPGQPQTASSRRMSAAPTASPATAPARYSYAPAQVIQSIPDDAPALANQLPVPAAEMANSNNTNSFNEALGSPCGGCGPPCQTCCPHWFGAIGGMILTRNNPNPTWTSAQVSNNNNQVMNTVDTMGNWTGLGEFTVGRTMCCAGAWGLTYWAIAPLSGFSRIRDPGNLLTPIDLFGVNIGGAPASDFFDNAQEHRIWRKDTFQNVEFNWYSMPLAVPNRPCMVTWLAGIRYFQFNEGLIFGSVAGGHEFGSDGGINEAYINSQVRNRLLGAQTGAIANYFIRPRVSFFMVPKFGIFNNFASENFQLYRGDGLNAFTVRGNANLLSFMGQFDTGLNFAITPRCSVYGGYRVLFVNGVGLADNQFPHYLIDQPEIGHIKPNGDLILHGAIFGLQFFF